MSNNKSFVIKNGLSAGRYLQSAGADGAGSIGYALSNATYDSKSFSVSGQDINTYGLAFKSDGTKMYTIGTSGGAIYQYTLSTAWDVSTASYDSVNFSVSGQDSTPLGLYFKSDGTKLYVIGLTGASVYQYSLSTAWDISTASYDSVSFSTSGQTTRGFDVTFGDSGSKMYVSADNLLTVFQYNLSTAWDLSTASYSSKSLSTSGQTSTSYASVFNTTGTEVFVVCRTNQAIYKYSLTTAWDLSTATYSSISFSVSSQITAPAALTFKTDGTKLFVLEYSGSAIFQYSTELPTQTLDLSTGHTFSFTPSGATTVSFTNPPASGLATGFAVEVINTGGYAITWPSSVKWHLGTAPTATATKEIYTFITTDGGTTYYGKKAGSDIA